MKSLNILKRQLRINNLSHAYLIYGPFEVEKIREILKIKKTDLFYIHERPIKINLIRELIHWLHLKPHSSSLKLAIFSAAENLTLEAANALLKVLEEPPEHSIIILQANKKDRILPTIASRCQVIQENAGMKDLLKDEIDDYLSFEKISHLSFKDRFDYAQKLTEAKNLSAVLNLWEQEFRQNLLRGEDVQDTLWMIVKTRGLLLTNTSVKLLLENLLLKI